MPDQEEVEHGDPRTLLYWLGRELRLTRERSDPFWQMADLGREIPSGLGGHADSGSLSKFERGLAWPSYPDLIVAGYARVLEVDRRLIWQRALSKFKKQAGELPSEKPLYARAAVQTGARATPKNRPAAGESHDKPISSPNRRAR
jgi:hypothetical protein